MGVLRDTAKVEIDSALGRLSLLLWEWVARGGLALRFRCAVRMVDGMLAGGGGGTLLEQVSRVDGLCGGVADGVSTHIGTQSLNEDC